MSQAATRSELAPPTRLVPVLSARWALGIRHLGVTAGFGLFFLYLNYLPLAATDVWGHVAYGKAILSRGALPSQDMVMPLAEGMPVVDTAWLAQVVLAAVESLGGAEALSVLFAVVVLATHLILTRVFYLQTGDLVLSAFGTALVVAVGWSRLSTIRPEIFGLFCFATLLLLLARREARETDARSPCRREPTGRRWHLWIGVPMLFATWVNLHGSFVCGWAVLGSYLLGRMIEVGWKSRRLSAVLADRDVRRRLVLIELAVLATLVNPYGADLLIYTARFAHHSNLRQVMEWAPMTIPGVGGLEFALSWVLLLVVLRHSRARVRAHHVFLLAVFAALAVSSIRMMSWYAPIVVVVLMPHLRDLSQRFARFANRTAAGERRTGRKWHYSLACVLMVWITFSFSSLSRPLLGGPVRTEAQLYANQTPRGATRHLRDNPPPGPIFNPQWWGDWLGWDGPPGLQVFVTTNIHLVPSHVWNDYLLISNAEPGWEKALQRYRISTVVVDRQNQPLLAEVLRAAEGWSLRYDDESALIYSREATPHDHNGTVHGT